MVLFLKGEEIMKKISRFMICDDYFDKRFANETGTVISFNSDGFHIDEVLFDDTSIHDIYVNEGKNQFEATDLLPSHQKGNRDVEFENKVKEALVSLLERGVLEISSNLNSDYDGKIIESKVLMDGNEVYLKEERISINF